VVEHVDVGTTVAVEIGRDGLARVYEGGNGALDEATRSVGITPVGLASENPRRLRIRCSVARSHENLGYAVAI
jgi:hypothetical protein